MINKLSIFGGTGFIGSRFCELYPDQVIRIDRNSPKTQSNNILYFISTVDNYNIHKDLHIDIETNLIVLMNTLQNLDRSDPNLVFNFVSSWFVYGKNDVMPFTENGSVCNPTGFYSITKRCAEQMLVSYCETFNIKYRIFRLANVLGEQDSKVSKEKNALQYLIKEVCQDRNIELYNNGNTLRDYIYVDDVCEAIACCLENSPVNEIINIGNGKPYLLADIVKDAIKRADSASEIVNTTPPHFHKVVQVENSYLDISKLKSYGFKSRYEIDDIVDKLVTYFKKE